MTYRPEKPKKDTFLIWKKCGNCKEWRFRWEIKKQKVFVKAINQIVTSQNQICGKCRKVVENAIIERNI
jgi:hypothetical protein